MALNETDKALLDATKPFVKETPLRGELMVFSTLLLWAASTLLTLYAPHPILRAAFTVITGLLVVRGFVLYHDAMHGALLRKSPIARAFITAFGFFTLTPPRIWCESHNYHHAHTAKLVGSHVGSFPVVTVGMWRWMKPRQKLAYAFLRSPLCIALGYATLFFYGMCVAPFARNPKKYWDSGVAMALNLAITFAVVALFGFEVFLRAYGIPMAIAFAVGGYLFYAQHNYPDAYFQKREEWRYTQAALLSSSYMKMGPVMRFFTANIGFHHVHHLNPAIPYYRLPEAMANVPALQTPGVTALSPRAIAACFSLKLWDPRANRMVPFPSASGAAQGESENAAA